jgi:hypothetical protein
MKVMRIVPRLRLRSGRNSRFPHWGASQKPETRPEVKKEWGGFRDKRKGEERKNETPRNLKK